MAFDDLFVASFKASELQRDIGPAVGVYEEGNIGGLIRVEQDIQPSEKYMRAAKSAIRNIGVVRKGHVMFTRSVPSGLEMQAALAKVLDNRGASSVNFVFHGLEEMNDAFLRGYDINPAGLFKFKEKYFEAIAASNHWTLVQGYSGVDLSETAQKHANDYFKVIPFEEYISHMNTHTFNPKSGNKGTLYSFNMISTPSQWCADNVGLPFDKYEDIILDAICIDGRDIFKQQKQFALDSFATRVSSDLIVGKPGKYRLSLGNTWLEFSVTNRPVFSDAAPAGALWNPVTNLPMIITNQPFGEDWVSPIEDKTNGYIKTSVLYKSESGNIEELRAKVVNGVIMPIEVVDKHRNGITRANVFLQDFWNKYKRTIGEIGIGNFNPALKPLAEIGKPTGHIGIDEKVYPLHVGVAFNVNYAGTLTRGAHRDISINSGTKLEIKKA